jgi:hypothetical protein
MPIRSVRSDGKLNVIIPRKLWGDREDDEGLPFPISHSLDRLVGQTEQATYVHSAAVEISPNSPAAAENLPIFAAASSAGVDFSAERVGAAIPSMHAYEVSSEFE